MATDRLKIYNGACILLGEQRLNTSTGLTENREIRFVLDEIFNDGGVNFCLEQAQWYFAMRSSRFDFDPSITPQFGLSRGFTKPDDWISTSGVFQEEYFREPLLDYADEAGFWYSDRDELFVRYVSNDASFGGDFARWPSTFTEYVKAYFAGKAAPRIPKYKEKIDLLLGPPGREDKGLVNRALLIAKNKSAMTQPQTFPSHGGSWVRARLRGRNRSFNDGGSISSLIG
jgi:hypothetical protein